MFSAKKLLAMGFAFSIPVWLLCFDEGGGCRSARCAARHRRGSSHGLAGAMPTAWRNRDGGTKQGNTVRNDRLFAVPLLLHQDRPPFELSDMPAAELKDIEDFLVAYQAADGKQAKVVGYLDRTEAESAVRKAAQP
jgi:hypothetical protein